MRGTLRSGKEKRDPELTLTLEVMHGARETLRKSNGLDLGSQGMWKG